VELDSEATPLDPLGLGVELSDVLGVKVDVGTADSLRPGVREEVLAEAVLL